MRLQLLTEPLELRAFEPADLDALHAVYGDPQVMRFMPAYPTLEHTRRALEIHMREARAGNPAFWALIERESAELIGDAGLGLIEGIGPRLHARHALVEAGVCHRGRARRARPRARAAGAARGACAGAACERGVDQRAGEDRDGARGSAKRLRRRAPRVRGAAGRDAPRY